MENRMKTSRLYVAAAVSCGVGPALAATPADVCASLAEARGALVAMLSEMDPSKLDAYRARVQSASARLDADLGAMAKGPDAARVRDFKGVWSAFKITREGEIIPALYAGDRERAKGLAMGIQAERVKAMKGTMGCQ